MDAPAVMDELWKERLEQVRTFSVSHKTPLAIAGAVMAIFLILGIIAVVISDPNLSSLKRTTIPTDSFTTNNNTSMVQPLLANRFKAFLSTLAQGNSSLLQPKFVIGLLVVALLVLTAVLLYVFLKKPAQTKDLMEQPVEPPEPAHPADDNSTWKWSSMGPYGLGIIFIVFVLIIVVAVSRNDGRMPLSSPPPRPTLGSVLGTGSTATLGSTGNGPSTQNLQANVPGGLGDEDPLFLDAVLLSLDDAYMDYSDYWVGQQVQFGEPNGNEPIGSVAFRQLEIPSSGDGKFQRVPVGLDNLGVNCYANSMMQCLAWVLPDLRQYLCGARAVEEFVNSTRIQGAVAEYFFHFLRVICLLQQGHRVSKEYYNPFLSALRSVNQGIYRNRYVDEMQDVSAVLDAIQDHREAYPALAKRLFGVLGVERIETRHCGGGHQVPTIDPSPLRLYYPLCLYEDVTDVQSGIDIDLSPNEIRGNITPCARCFDYKLSSKASVSKAGTVMAILVRNFYADGGIGQAPSFSPLGINVGGYQYTQMTAAVVHFGHSVGGGHYAAFLRLPGSQELWFVVNDSYTYYCQQMPELFVNRVDDCRVAVAFYK